MTKKNPCIHRTLVFGTLLACCLLPAGAQQSCTLHSDCSTTEVCLSDVCQTSIASLAFDAVARFATGDAAATYDLSTSTTFGDLFQCTRSDPLDDVPLTQHKMWEGFVEYAIQENATDVNTIYLYDETTGQTVEVVDAWGDRCASNTNSAVCQVSDTRYAECADAQTCVPEVLEYDGAAIDIYEPCNFASNLAYYRVMPQLCGANSHFYMDAATMDAFSHAFGNLAAGSSLWHGSHTYLGQRADNVLIAVVAYLNHQVVVKALDQASPGDPDIHRLMDITQTPPRPRTAVEMSKDVSQVITGLPISEWPQQLVDLDIPEYESTFGLLVASILTTLFPTRDLSFLLNSLGGLLGAGTDDLNNIYVPILKDLTANLNLTNENKFVLFRQLLGMASKMVFAFLWQEQVIQIDLFLQPGTNQIAPDIMAPLISLFNFITGFVHVDNDFQTFNRMYPGDAQCRVTQPHAKWHEISASALLDMVYHTDCVAAVVTGSGACAHLANLNNLGSITRSEISAWIDANIVIPNIPIIKDIVPPIIEETFLVFDLNNDDVIDWTDVEMFMNTAEDVMDIIAAIEDFIERYQNFCIDDSPCTADEFCNPLQFTCRPKRPIGFWPCIENSQCYSNRCVDVTRVCGCNADSDCASDEWCNSNLHECKPKREFGWSLCIADNQCFSGECSSGYCTTLCSSHSDCGDEDNLWCNPNYSPDICRPRRDNGYFPCTHDRQCKSDRCVDTTRVCARKKNNGESCLANKECLSNRCRFFRCRS